jgi:hypothetical protein
LRLGGEAGASALFDPISKFLHRFLRNCTSFAACKGSLRHVNGG